MIHLPVPPIARSVSVLILSFILSQTAHSQSSTWDGSNGTLWSDNTNWSGDTVPGIIAGNIATFSGNTTDVSNNVIIDLSGSTTTGGITFGSSNAAPYTVGIAGTDTLTIVENADIIVNSNVVNNQTIAANIILSDGTGTNSFSDEIRLTNSSTTASLIFTGDIAAGTGGTTPGLIQRLWLNGDGDILVSGNINETAPATSASAIDLFVANNGEKTFSGTANTTTNNYLRTYIRDNGTLTLASGSDLGTGNFQLRYGTLNINNATQQFSNTLLLGSSSQGNGNSFINIGASSTLQLNTDVTYQGKLVTGNNTIANTATISGGTLQLTGANRTFDIIDNTLIAGAEVTISSNITNDGSARTLIKGNTGTLLLSGNNTHGATTVNNGLLIVAGGSALSDAHLLTLNKNGSLGNLQLNNDETIGSLSGDGDINLQANTLTAGDASNTTYSGLLSGTGGGLTKSGTGNLTLSNTGTHTYTGDTTINGGLLTVSSSTLSSNITVATGGNLGGEFTTSGNLTFSGGTHTFDADLLTSNSLGTSANLNVMVPATITVNVANAAAGNVSILEYGTRTGTGVANFALGSNTSSARGFQGFVDTGSAIAVNLGYVTNTWIGGNGTNPTFWDISTTENWTNSADSVFETNDDVVFGDTATGFAPTLQSDITVGSVTFTNSANDYIVSATGGNLLTVNKTISANGSNAVTFAGNVSGGSNGLIIDGSGDLTFDAEIQGSNGLTKNGTGTTTLNNVAPTYTGDTNINAGTLVFFNNAITAQNTLTHNIASGAILEYNTNGANRSDPDNININGGGTFKKSGGGQFSLVSSNSKWGMDDGGLVHVEGGIFNFGGGTPGQWQDNFGDMQIDIGAVFEGRATGIQIDELRGFGTIGIGGKASGSGLREGLTLGAANGTAIFDGVIKNTTDWDGAGTDYGNQGAVEFALIKIGTGTQTLNGDNTYTGNTTVSEGQLNIGGTNVSTITVTSGGNLGGEGSTSGNITFSGTTHTLDIDAGTAAALGSTGTGFLQVDAIDNGFTVNVTRTGGGNISVLNYGSSGFTGNLTAFTLGANTSSARGIGGFVDTGSAIAIDLGYVTNTWTGTAANSTFWDVGTTANWSNAKDSVFQNLDDVIFDDTATGLAPTLQSDVTAGTVTFSNHTKDFTLNNNGNGETLTIANALNLTGNATTTLNAAILSNGDGFNFAGAGNTSVNGILSGTAPLNQSGSGTTTLSATNTYTGTTTISNGVLVADAASGALGNGGNVTFSGGTLQYTANSAGDDYGTRIKNSGSAITLDSNGQDVTLAGVIDNSNTGGLTKIGSGNLTLTGTNTFTGNTTVNEGTLTLQGAAIGVSRAYSPIASGATLEFDSTGTSVNGGIISITGNGTWKKSGTNEYVQTSANTVFDLDSGGLIHIAEGIYRFGAGGLGDFTSNLGDMQIDSGATYEGRRTAIFIDTLTGDGIIGIGGTTTGFGAGTALRLGVDDGSGTFTGVVRNTNGDGELFTLEKVGSGTQTLNGNNTYTGATTVTAGQLNIGGTNVSSITVGTGAGSGANLGGEGSTSGNITFTETTHTLAIDAGTAAALGTTGSGTTDWSLATGNITVNVTGSGTGAITVLTYGSGIGSSSLSKLELGTSASARGAVTGFVDDLAGNITIDLGFQNAVWTGNATAPGNVSFWDIATNDNWTTTDTFFQTGDDVTFDETATTTTAALQSSLTAGSVTFSSSGTAYTLNDNGGGETLTVTTGLFIEDAGDVTLNAAITGAGSLTNSGSGTTIIAGNTSLAGGLTLSGTGSTSISGVIGGTGGLAKSGSGTTTLNASNSYTGDTTVAGGTLVLASGNAIAGGSAISLTAGTLRTSGTNAIGSNATFTMSGGTLNIAGSDTINDSVAINQSGGAITLNDGTSETLHSINATAGVINFGTGTNSGNLTLNNDSTIFQITVGAHAILSTATGTTTHVTNSITGLGGGNSFTFDVQGDGLAIASFKLNASGGGAVNKTGTGTLQLTADTSDWRGGSTFENGLVEFTSIGNVNQASSLGFANSFNHVFKIGSDTTAATIRLIGTAGNSSSNRSIQIGDMGATIEVKEASKTLTLSGNVSGSGTTGNGALTTGGAGTVVLSGNNSYTGGTTVSAGTLLVNNTVGSGTGSGAVTVNAGTLGGSGTISGNVTVNSAGNHTAGTTNTAAPTAIQTLGSDVTYSADAGGSSITWDLIANSSSTAGTEFDQFALSGGDIDFTNTTNFILDFNGSGADGAVDWVNTFWDTDQEWALFTNVGSVTNLSNLQVLNTNSVQDINGNSFSGSRLAGGSFAFSESSGNIVLNYSSAVPEPGTYGIFGLGLALFGWTARRRRRKAAAEAVSD